ncbi:hypothetical protein F5883DRAFT_418567 [Diaporthe sp. PMI_573]|nr:hypothetical protein F5883DRAFT_418567 [Diaporthaceae sp. PMI_573]
MYTNPLPEDELLRGHFFAREAEVACLPAVEATIAAVQTAEGAAVDQAQEESLTDCETESKAQKEEQTERKNEDARQRNGQVEGDAQKTQEEEEQREAEAEEARETKLMRQERLLRDPPLFPAGWFKNSKYDFDERQARHHYVQDAGTCDNRSRQLLCLAVQLIGVFFELHTDENGRHWISVLGGPLLKSSTHIKMPEIVEREGGVKVVYVDPSYCVTNIEKETNKMAMEEEKRQIGEENSKVTMDMVTAVEETAKGDTDKVSAAYSQDTLIY